MQFYFHFHNLHLRLQTKGDLAACGNQNDKYKRSLFHQITLINNKKTLKQACSWRL